MWLHRDTVFLASNLLAWYFCGCMEGNPQQKCTQTGPGLSHSINPRGAFTSAWQVPLKWGHGCLSGPNFKETLCESHSLTPCNRPIGRLDLSFLLLQGLDTPLYCCSLLLLAGRLNMSYTICAELTKKTGRRHNVMLITSQPVDRETRSNASMPCSAVGPVKNSRTTYNF